MFWSSLTIFCNSHRCTILRTFRRFFLVFFCPFDVIFVLFFILNVSDCSNYYSSIRVWLRFTFIRFLFTQTDNWQFGISSSFFFRCFGLCYDLFLLVHYAHIKDWRRPDQPLCIHLQFVGLSLQLHVEQKQYCSSNGFSLSLIFFCATLGVCKQTLRLNF